MKLQALVLLAIPLIVAAPTTVAQGVVYAEATQPSVLELRSSVGHWTVTTQLLDIEGSITKKVSGTYEFSWVVQDRILAGKSETP